MVGNLGSDVVGGGEKVFPFPDLVLRRVVLEVRGEDAALDTVA